MMSFPSIRAGSVIAAALILFTAEFPAIAVPNYPGDFDGDGDVDLQDLAALLGVYGTCDGDPEYDPAADFDLSGCVDLADLATLLGNYGTLEPPVDMVIVPAGEFEMGDIFNESNSDELPVHEVYLGDYYIDIYEVSNQRYADALNWALNQGELIHVSSGYVYQYGGTTYGYCATTTSSSYSRIRWDGGTFTVTPGKEQHPMTQVTWYGAVAFCNWRSAMEGKPLCYNLTTWTCDFGVGGYRLPTEAEWEKAAGWDPVQQRHFRFGEHTDGCGFNCLDGERANFRQSGDPFETLLLPWTTPVGFYNGELHQKVDFGWPGSATEYQTQDAQSYYGCRDMSGNAWEWCYDWYDAWYYSSSPYANPIGPSSGTYRVMRGGVWLDYTAYSRSAKRSWYHPYQYVNGGFRCVFGTP